MTYANDKAVLNSNNIYEILEQSGKIKLQVLRKGKLLHIIVDPEMI